MTDKKDQTYKVILSELRKALSEAKITQIEIGDALGVKQSAVSSLLSGKSRMSLDQFLTLAELVGLRPQNILQAVQNQMSQVVPMTPQLEETMYRSDAHILAYCLAVREVAPTELNLNGVSQTAVVQAFEDLVKVGLLAKKKNKYIQNNPQMIYRAPSRTRGSKAHQAVVARSWDVFDRNHSNKAFIATKFNAYIVDRFTVSQTKEIEASLWKVFEKVQSFRQTNLASGYTEDEAMPLWNLHLMLNTPIDP